MEKQHGNHLYRAKYTRDAWRHKQHSNDRTRQIKWKSISNNMEDPNNINNSD